MKQRETYYSEVDCVHGQNMNTFLCGNVLPVHTIKDLGTSGEYLHPDYWPWSAPAGPAKPYMFSVCANWCVPRQRLPTQAMPTQALAVRY